MLIENNFLKFEEFIIDVNDRKIIIANCNVTTDLFTKPRDLYVRRNIHVNQIIIILTDQKIVISIKLSITENRNFLFKLFCNVNVKSFHHVIYFYTNKVVIKNDPFKSVKSSRNFRFETVIKMIYDDRFLITSKKSHIIMITSTLN